MKIGDRVRIIKVPAGLRDDDDLRTRTLFDLCLGRIFPIAGIEANRIELHVGEVLGAPAYIHSIYIEPENVEAVETSG
ncbi:MAG: hypothetical protein Q8L53_05230 [Aestuariivirga sp.]|nr:hypothetical protein [Aestuariivirga sp.]